ncbi:MAG TPA: FIST N-terminal domain-containing protein [Clostridia bacterium]|nr:FIST N-terminal domain-containing protein [Clostridia bacterium]
MKLEQKVFTRTNGWDNKIPALGDNAQLVLVFGGLSLIKDSDLLRQVKSMYPGANLLGCSTAGSIKGSQVLEDSLCLTAIYFEKSKIKGALINLSEAGDSLRAGELLANALPAALSGSIAGTEDKLVHVLVLSEGMNVNGSELLRGLSSHLPDSVGITGGMSSDSSNYQETLVFLDSKPARNTIAAVGLYGSQLEISYSSRGGWDQFGPERKITRSKGNVLYEFDGQPALALYKKYLGDLAADLPTSGLQFPVGIHTGDNDPIIVRSLHAINENDQSVSYAGDIPEGAKARLMKANIERLITASSEAAQKCLEYVNGNPPQLAFLITCYGRMLVLRQRTEEEVECVSEVFGENTVLTGFFSYGEFSPYDVGYKCALHNETMTITTISEV